MKISEGRINSLSREIAKSMISQNILDDDRVDNVTKQIKKGFVFFLQEEAHIDVKVREKISTLKRGVPEGSGEWEVLYRKYFNEEISKI